MIDPATTWVTSDTHFGHDNIVGFCHRPLDHEQAMIAEWRAAVPDDATVLHLGDLVYRGNAFFRHIVAKELTGARKLLVQGNHDRQRFSFYRDAGFRIIKPFSLNYGTFDDPKAGVRRPYEVSFDHYPRRRDQPPAPWELHIHGHIHNNGYGGKQSPFVPFAAGQINVSVEQTHYRPVRLQDLLDGALLGCYEPVEPAGRDRT